MTDSDQPLPPHADETPLAESQDAIDDAKHFAAERLDVSPDEPSDEQSVDPESDSESAAELEDLPGGGDGAPADGPAPAA